MKLCEIDRICPTMMWDNFCGDTEIPEEVIIMKEELEELKVASLLEREAIKKGGYDDL